MTLRMVQVNSIALTALVGSLVALVLLRDHALHLVRSRLAAWLERRGPAPASPDGPDVHVPAAPQMRPVQEDRDEARARERQALARLQFTVDGNVRWLMEALDDSRADDAMAALGELVAVYEHLQQLGRLGRRRMVEYCNAVVDADGLDLLHALSEGRRPAVEHPGLRDAATRLFQALVPLIYG